MCYTKKSKWQECFCKAFNLYCYHFSRTSASIKIFRYEYAIICFQNFLSETQEAINTVTSFDDYFLKITFEVFIGGKIKKFKISEADVTDQQVTKVPSKIEHWSERIKLEDNECIILQVHQFIIFKRKQTLQFILSLI